MLESTVVDRAEGNKDGVALLEQEILPIRFDRQDYIAGNTVFSSRRNYTSQPLI